MTGFMQSSYDMKLSEAAFLPQYVGSAARQRAQDWERIGGSYAASFVCDLAGAVCLWDLLEVCLVAFPSQKELQVTEDLRHAISGLAIPCLTGVWDSNWLRTRRMGGIGEGIPMLSPVIEILCRWTRKAIDLVMENYIEGVLTDLKKIGLNFSGVVNRTCQRVLPVSRI